MELHIPPVSKKSVASEKAFEKDDRVVSLLVRSEEEALRFDILECEEESYELAGDLICRWTLLFKPKSKDDKEAQEALKLTADNLFISLFEGEDGPTQENAKLKHLLGLMLERRRLLRVKERDASFTLYVHRPTKIEYSVPNVELDPQFFIENQEKLAFLDVSASSGSGESKKEEKATPASPASD